MLIRTQSKMRVCNLQRMEEISIEKRDDKRGGETAFFLTMRFSSEETDNCELGEFSTQKRAVEILDEICLAYLNLNSFSYRGEVPYVKNGIFQMPEA